MLVFFPTMHLLFVFMLALWWVQIFINFFYAQLFFNVWLLALGRFIFLSFLLLFFFRLLIFKFTIINFCRQFKILVKRFVKSGLVRFIFHKRCFCKKPNLI